MPIYEFACEACRHEFEIWTSIHDTAIPKCPSCGKKKARRLISTTSFSLKGTGWYVTDYKNGSGTNKKKEKPDSGEKASKVESA